MAAAVLASVGGCSGGGGGGGAVDSGSGGSTSDNFTAPDGSAPSVIKTSPGNGATKVPLDAKVQATFSEDIVAVVIDVQFDLVNKDLNDTLGSYSTYDETTRTATLDPYGTLQEYTLYEASLQNIMDSQGNIMPDYVWTFRTKDLTPPTTTSSVVGTLFNTPLTVTLTCADPKGSGCGTTFYSTDGGNPAAVYSGPFVLGEGSYNLRFYSVDNEGNAGAVSAGQAFRIDLTPPTVIDKSPASGAVDVHLRSAISVVFSEDMDAASLTPSTITLDNNLGGTVTYDAATKTATLVPSRRLTCGTAYRATVTTGVTDLAANHLAADYSWNFTAVNDCDEPVTTADTASGVISAGGTTVNLSCFDSSACTRIVYTTDGTMPSFEPVNGTVVAGASAPILLPEGAHRLRYFAEDLGGNREVPREQHYVVSTQGVLHVATTHGIARGAGPNPDQFVVEPHTGSSVFSEPCVFNDPTTGRLYKGAEILLYSDDQGLSWRTLNGPENWKYGANAIWASGGRVLVGTDWGLLVSDDGLATYKVLTTESGLATYGIDDIAVHDNAVYVATGYGLSVSQDYGYTFVTRRTESGLGSYDVRAVFADGQTVYAATSAGLAISKDGGATFENRTSANNGLLSNDVADVFAVGSTVYAATYNGLSVSTDGGTTFTNTTAGASFNYGSIKSVLQFGSAIYIGTDDIDNEGNYSGLFVSTDGGNTFTRRNAMPGETTDLFSDGTAVYALSESLGVAVTSDGVNFTRRGLFGAPRALYVSGQDVYAAVQGGVAISADGGSRFVARTPVNGIGSVGTTSIAMVPASATTPARLYVGTNAGLSVSSDNGSTFVNLTTADGLPDNDVHDVASDGTYAYVATDGGLSVSKPASKFVQFTTYGSTTDIINPAIDDVYIDSGKIYITTPWRFAYADLSTNLGDVANWTYLPFAQAFDVYARGSYVHVAESPNVTNGGFHTSNDGGATFSVNTAVSYPWGLDVSGWGDYVYTAADNTLQVSADNGATFTTKGPFTLEEFYLDTYVTDVAYAP